MGRSTLNIRVEDIKALQKQKELDSFSYKCKEVICCLYKQISDKDKFNQYYRSELYPLEWDPIIQPKEKLPKLLEKK